MLNGMSLVQEVFLTRAYIGLALIMTEYSSTVIATHTHPAARSKRTCIPLQSVNSLVEAERQSLLPPDLSWTLSAGPLSNSSWAERSNADAPHGSTVVAAIRRCTKSVD